METRQTEPAARSAATQAGEVATTAAEHGTDVAGEAMDRTKQVAAEAQSQVRDVALAAKEQASEVTSTATEQVRSLVDDTRTQLRSQAETQAQTAASALRRLGDQVQALTDGRAAEAGPVADYARSASDVLNRLAGHVESRGIEGITRDVEQFARRRPGTFLLGAALAGFGLGRLVRAGQQPRPQAGAVPTGGAAPLPVAATPPVVDITDTAIADMTAPDDTLRDVAGDGGAEGWQQ